MTKRNNKFNNKFYQLIKHPFVSALLQIASVIFVLYLVALWQQHNMLNDDETLSAPDFTAPTLNGKSFNFATFRQQQPTLVYFFAPWCQVCNFSIDTIQSIAEDPDYNSIKIMVVALDWQSRQDVENFVNRHQLTVPVVLAPGSLGREWKIQGYPSYYLINSQGKIVSRDTGLTTKAGLLWRLSTVL